MWILSKNGKCIVNSDITKNFYVDSIELMADDVPIGIFGTEDEAKKELKQIYDALIAGQESYSVG